MNSPGFWVASFFLPAIIAWSILISSCGSSPKSQAKPIAEIKDSIVAVRPLLATESAAHDTDDPAIWIHPTDPAQSLILGTDKDSLGALYVYDLNGKIIEDKVVYGLQRPNNVDVEYGLLMDGKPVDIAVVTERYTHSLRVFSLPDMKPIDGGGIPVFVGEEEEEFRDLMGIGVYKRPSDGRVFAIVGRKSGPQNGTYLWQYELTGQAGRVNARLVRKFGNFSGKKEIEAIALDDKLGYVYYSDEHLGVRKYYADPDSLNTELSVFATSGFSDDCEGISLYELTDSTGYILVSDQGSNRFHVFPREGTRSNPHEHPLRYIIHTSTLESDGSEVTFNTFAGRYKGGLFVAMSDDRTFQFYQWTDLIGDSLEIRP
jgi:3-phytase